MRNLWKLAIVTSATALLLACGGGGSSDGPISVAASAPPVVVDATNGSNSVQAMTTSTIVFASGVPSFGTTGSTTLQVVASPIGTPPPSFTITSGGFTASGDLTFATPSSCVFTVKSSTFVAASALAAGKKVTASPCILTLATAGAPATGVSTTINVTLTLGTVTSAPYKATVAISPTGTVMVNGLTVVTVQVRPLTGA